MPPAPTAQQAAEPTAHHAQWRVLRAPAHQGVILIPEQSVVPLLRRRASIMPFVWESQPGMPKDAYSSSRMMLAAGASTPVITPPPSYHLRGAPLDHSARRHGKACGGRCSGYKLRWIKVGFIATIFRRLSFGSSCRSSSSLVKPSLSTR